MPPTSMLLRRALMDQEDEIARAGAFTPQMLQAKNTQERWQQFPGSMPGGTGLTGLNSQDSKGWTDMQNDNIAGLRAMSDEPIQVQGVQRNNDFARQSFSVGGGMDAHQENRARLLEALLLNQGDPSSLISVGTVRVMNGRW